MTSSSSLQTVLSSARLKLKHLDSFRLDSEILLAKAIKKKRSFIYAYPDYLLNQEQLVFFDSLVKKRVEGTPLAYITGKQEFWSTQFSVSADVLIPRPETELLVETTLLKIRRNQEAFIHKRLLDLGTGSGCIAISLAKELPDWHVTAIDICDKALAIAKQNASDNQIHNISFLKSNWFAQLERTHFDIIVSNPPYIDKDDPELEKNVIKHEPKVALIAEDEGLAHYKKIIQESIPYLNKLSHLIFEIGYTQAAAIQGLLTNFSNIEIHQDLQKLDRVISAKKE